MVIPTQFQATPIEFTNGQLSQDLSVWVGSDRTPVHSVSGSVRTKLEINDPDIPTRDQFYKRFMM